jgi:dTDP-4-dehydrorhamnose reductase
MLPAKAAPFFWKTLLAEGARSCGLGARGDGTASAPYSESDLPNPRGTYASSKLLGEWFALEAPRAYVLRVESFFGSASAGRPDKGTVAAIVNTIMSGGEARVFEDRTVSPTYVIDAARATRRIVERRIEPGLYHCVNEGHSTWLEFARELARLLGIEARLRPVRMVDVPMRAERPLYCALSIDKLTAAGVTMPAWQDALGRYLQQLRNNLTNPIANRQAGGQPG